MTTIRVWQRADGWTEIEGPGGLSRRYQYPQEVEAFLDGIAVGRSLALDAIREIPVDDRRPVEVVPPERRLG